jgi:DNA-binding NarL/FixJ family response regulator
MPLIRSAASQAMRHGLNAFAHDEHLNVTPEVLLLLADRAAVIAGGLLSRQAAQDAAQPWRTAAQAVPAPAPAVDPGPLRLLLATPGSLEVLGLLDRTTADIAGLLGVNQNRVRYLVRRWYAVSGQVSRTGLAAWGRRQGLVPGGGAPPSPKP